MKFGKYLPRTLLLVVMMAMTAGLYAENYYGTTLNTIRYRIKPVGKVNVAKANPATNASESGDENLTATNNENSNPKVVYNKYCAVCHKTGAANAPVISNTAAWKIRIAQGTNTLNEHAIKGYKMMPPKGTCMSCTNSQIKAVVAYMAKQSK